MRLKHRLLWMTYRMAVYLNRIAKELRETAADYRGTRTADVALNAAREIEDLVYSATQPKRGGVVHAGSDEAIEEWGRHVEWRERLEREARTNPDALIDWVRFGFPRKKATAS